MAGPPAGAAIPLPLTACSLVCSKAIAAHGSSQPKPQPLQQQQRRAAGPEAPSSAAPTSSSSAPLAAVLAAAALGVGASTARQGRRARHVALRATATTPSRAKRNSQDENAGMLEAVLLDMFDKSEEPNIFEVRDCLSRLARLQRSPNANISGEWIIFWASREFCVDRIFGSGATGKDEMWLRLQEFLIRFTKKKDGRKVEAAEVVRKVGPFPNEHHQLKGTYSVAGTNGLRITFDDIKKGQEDPLEVNGRVVEKKTIDLDVIYSSKRLIALQHTDEADEYDFFVLTPVQNVQYELEKLLGLHRARLFFN